MSAEATKIPRLLRMEIVTEQDVVLCRQRARKLASGLGFDSQGQTRIATALSEIARNACLYAGGGMVEFALETLPRFAAPSRPRQNLVITVRDSGSGIASLEDILAGRYHSESGLGLGISGARRLMGSVEISTSSAGSLVVMRKTLPAASATVTPAQAQAIVDEISLHAPPSAAEEMHIQNRELLRAMEDATAREEEVGRMNQELAETNTGVLALYDELETLHRVSVLLASKLELNALTQSIIDVTTELTGSDLGAFFFRNDAGDGWTLHAIAGPAASSLKSRLANVGKEFFGEDFTELKLFGDLEAQAQPCCASNFASLVGDCLEVRSCLVVPLVAARNQMNGAMIFAAGEPRRFTERSERIIRSIAAQAVVGLENSRLYQAVKETNEAKDRFFAMLSHELRTPLNPVLAIVSDWEGDEHIPSGMKADVAVVSRNIRLEARLIDDLLDFNKLINGKLQLNLAPLDWHDLIRSVVEICRADLDTAGLALELKLDASDAIISGDDARLQQVLWNVLKNAIKFTPANGSISVTTTNPRQGALQTVIRDSGRGIEPAALKRIFGAFEQAQPQVFTEFGGLGLGLAIAKSFVDRHGGSISASSRGQNLGAEITIDLPVSSAKALGLASPALRRMAPDEAAPCVRILLIEDHADTINILSRLLKRKGHLVTAATSGEAARAAFARAMFDVVISDLGLPDCSGLDLMNEFRGIRPIAGIALSGYGMDSDIAASKAAGFAEHLTKPVDMPNLLRSVERLARKS